MIVLHKYNDSLASIWDAVVKGSKNGNFLHTTPYLRYHEDRFNDESIIIHRENKAIAVFPAHRIGDTIYSHCGITYSGLIYGKGLHCKDVLEIFGMMKDHFRASGITKIIYKSVPSIFTTYPAEEDLYALYRSGARLVSRDISSVIELESKPNFSDSRKCVIRKAEKNKAVLTSESNIDDFYHLLSTVLLKYGVRPVHTLSELKLLMGRFPDNIKLYSAHVENELLAAALIYDFGHVVHTQYLASSDHGRRIGALDFVLANLIENVYQDKKYFSFGKSTEDNGYSLNEGLIAQKEGFGGRGIVIDQYEWDL